ncbi:MAG: oxidoreductase [Hyphomicrobiaceae bacterium]|nr:oxidoreductase [Hyphomicrobiaceae bacterium]MCC0022952.1 oxidoreductase [Hyphomicrobiaceae bacterium]
MSFRAILIEKADDTQSVRLANVDEADLPEADVTIDVAYSTLNYKDALALTGSAPIVRQYPMVPGVDFAGTVSSSEHPEFKSGDQVILNGWGVGEKHWGGLAQKARVRGDWLIRMPEELTPARAMACGTAGYTAALCLIALEHNGVEPGHGPVLVTGATGGVGLFSIALLKAVGYDIIASTGKPDEADHLRALGASEIIDRHELSDPGRPLGKERWAAAIDAVGGHTLANVCAQTRYGGTVAACGMAQSLEFPASVAPFILRGVTLAGVDSVMRPAKDRVAAWARLARDLDWQAIDPMIETIGLGEVEAAARKQIGGQTAGRVVVDVNK